MTAQLIALALCSVLTQPRTSRAVTLVLPHTLRQDELATLTVAVGAIPRSAEIEITTPAGRPLGVISPYGIRSGNEAGTYTVPLPAEAISGRRVRLLISITANGTKRAPTKKEVKRLRVHVARHPKR
jgi:hypothetical protein